MEAFTKRVEMEDDESTSTDVTDKGNQAGDRLQQQDSPPPRLTDGLPDATDADSYHQQHQEETEESTVRHNFTHRRHICEAPEFSRRLNVFEEVEPGGTVAFECQVRAFPRPIIKWFKDDVEMTFNVDENAHQQRITADDSTNLLAAGDNAEDGHQLEPGVLRLVIRDAGKEDEGAYRCKAENEEGVAATTGYLSVTTVSSSTTQQQQQRSASPRSINAVSTPPLLRAITEQQSMEEREAAAYVEQGDLANDVDDEDVPAVGGLDASSPDWNYIEFLKAAGIETDLQSAGATGDSSTDTEGDIDESGLTALSAGLTLSSAPGQDMTTTRAASNPTAELHITEDEPPAAVNVFVCEHEDARLADDGEDGQPRADPGMVPLQIGPPVRPTADQGDVGFGPQDEPLSPDALGDSTAGVSASPGGGDSSATATVQRAAAAPGRQSFQMIAAAAAVAAGPPLPAVAAKENGEDDVFPAAEAESRPASSSAVDVVIQSKSATTLPKDERLVEVSSPASADAPLEPIVLFGADVSQTLEAYMALFDLPHVVYVLLVVVGALLAAAVEADPSSLVVVVGLLSLVCFFFFPPFAVADSAE